MKYFKPEEFLCKCGRKECDAPTVVDEELVEKLDILRKSVNRPLVITSALRCAFHNAKVGGASDSAHLTGRAADILVRANSERFELERHIFCRPVPLFLRLGHAGAHLHVDVGGMVFNLTWIEGGT